MFTFKHNFGQYSLLLHKITKIVLKLYIESCTLVIINDIFIDIVYISKINIPAPNLEFTSHTPLSCLFPNGILFILFAFGTFDE